MKPVTTGTMPCCMTGSRSRRTRASVSSNSTPALVNWSSVLTRKLALTVLLGTPRWRSRAEMIGTDMRSPIELTLAMALGEASRST